MTRTASTSIRYARGARLDAARMAGAPPASNRAGATAEAIADALALRRERPRLFPGAADNERRDEIREGLASYTGVAAWADSPADARRAAASALAGGESQPSFSETRSRVRTRLRCAAGRSPAGMAPTGSWHLGPWRPARLRNQQATDDGCCRGSGALRRGNAANGGGGARSGAAGPLAELRRRFVDGPVLTMPAGGRGTSDTTGSVGIPGVGTVFFRNFTLSAQWGRLNADGGVLRAADGATLSVPVTEPLEGTTLQGDGWSATLNSGWVVRPAARPGSFTIAGGR